MTKVRPPLSPAGALTTIAGLIGWPRVSDLVGRADSTVRDWSDPDTTRSVTFHHMLQLDSEHMVAGGGYRPFAAAFAAASDVEDARIGAEVAGLAEAAAKAAKESGEAQAATIEAMIPGASVSALHIAEVQTAEACEAQSRVLQRIRAMIARSKR